MGSRSLVPLLSTGRAVAARMARGQAAAAIRIPERVRAQLRLVFPAQSPRLFVHEGARQALERKLRAAFPGPVILSITDNRHSIITHRVQRGVAPRAHPPHVPRRPPRRRRRARPLRHQGRPRRQRHAGRLHRRQRLPVARRKRSAPARHKGKHHDLLALYGKLNDRYFDGTINVLITWGKRPTTRLQRAPHHQARKLQRRRPPDPRPPGARPQVGTPLLRRVHRLPRDAAPRDSGQPRPGPREHAPARVQGARARVSLLPARPGVGKAPRREAAPDLGRRCFSNYPPRVLVFGTIPASSLAVLMRIPCGSSLASVTP